VATATFNNTTIRPLISVDWLHRGKLPLQVQDRGLCGLDGSSFSRSLTDSYHSYATFPHNAADVREVEADQSLDRSQVRNGTNGEDGLLLSVPGIAGASFPGLLTDIGAEMTELHGSPRDGRPHQPAMDRPAGKSVP
jgi:hypothetical protein